MKPATSRRGLAVLLATIVGSSMSMIDGTAVNVALPALQRDFEASAAQLQWVVEGYAVVLAALILLGGALGDRFGRRLVFAIGIAVFALASIACGFAPNIETLIAARCVQGLGGALATPGSLALISASFDGAERGRAIGTWSGFSAITSALGPVLGGWLVQIASWRLVFFINVPLAALVFVALGRGVAESRDDAAPRRLDLLGATLATAGLAALVYGLIALQGAVAASRTTALVAIAAGVVALAAFVIAERFERSPMLRLALFRSRTFSLTNGYTFLLYGALGGSLYFVPFDAIDVQHYTPAAAGAVMLPLIALIFGASRWSGGLVARTGPRLPLVLGAVVSAAGFLLFATIGTGKPYVTSFLPAVLVLGAGLALLVAPLTTSVMDAVDASHAGIASAVNNAVSRAAGLVAIALFGIVLAAVFERSFFDGAAIRSASLTSATVAVLSRERAILVAGHVPPAVHEPRQRAAVQRQLDRAYARGFAAVMLSSAALCLGAALLALLIAAPRGSPAAAPVAG